MSIDELPNNPNILRSELERLHAGAWHWALSQMHGDRDAADDLLQQVYLMIIEGRALFGGKSSLKTWLYGVIHNAGRHHHRRSLRERLRNARWFAEAEAQTAIDPTTTRHTPSESARISQAIRSLPQRQRDVLELVIYRDFSLGESAAILGLSLGSARTHYHRAKQHLQKVLTQSIDSEQAHLGDNNPPGASHDKAGTDV